jgi:signal transduction histidine kinase
VSNASHELRTPLTSIIGSLEVSLRAKRSEEDYRKTLETVLNETEHLNELLNSLLELAQATIVDEDRQDVRLDELMWQVKDEYAAHHEVELIYHLPADKRLYTFSCNRHLLFLAIGNILKNAIKFSDGKRVDCVLTATNLKTSLLIRDYGIGIHEEDRKNIFRPFFRATNAKKYDGVGIGLSLSEKIFRLHNVSLIVQSHPGKGTDMIMEFPQH